MKSFFPLVAGSLLLSSCAGPAPKSDPSGNDHAGKQYKIAYNVLVDSEADDYDIFTVNPDGTGAANITNNEDVAWTYLAGRDRIYFISDRDTCRRCYLLYFMDADGGNIRRVSEIRLRDSWMSSRKDGKELIVNPHPSVDSAFYIMDESGNVLQKIPYPLPFANDPCFSPDGKKIVFRGADRKSKREEGFMDELYLINEDGTGLTRLTHYPADDTTAAWYAYKAGPPRWNARDNFITYQSFQDGKYSLYAVSPDGSRQWKLTDLSYNEGWHDWSPDGRWLAIELFDTEQTRFNIGLLDWQSKKLTLLTDTIYKYQQAPSFIEISR